MNKESINAGKAAGMHVSTTTVTPSAGSRDSKRAEESAIPGEANALEIRAPGRIRTSGGGSPEAEPGHRWTFLTNHAHVLTLLHSNPDLVLREVAARVGITERAVQRIVQELEDGGFIRREKVGRQNRYQVRTDKSLRHPIEAHRKIGDLLQLFVT